DRPGVERQSGDCAQRNVFLFLLCSPFYQLLLRLVSRPERNPTPISRSAHNVFSTATAFSEKKIVNLAHEIKLPHWIRLSTNAAFSLGLFCLSCFRAWAQQTKCPRLLLISCVLLCGWPSGG